MLLCFVHYSDVIMSTMASQITSASIVYTTVCSGSDQRKHQSSAPLAFVRGIHRWPVKSPQKGPVTRKMFPFDDVLMWYQRRISIGFDIGFAKEKMLTRCTNAHVYPIPQIHKRYSLNLQENGTVWLIPQKRPYRISQPDDDIARAISVYILPWLICYVCRCVPLWYMPDMVHINGMSTRSLSF